MKPRKHVRRRPSLTAHQAAEIRAEIDAALITIARKHYLSVGYLIRLASVGGSAQA